MNKGHQPKVEKLSSEKKLPLRWYDFVCIAVIAIATILFLLHRNYNVSQEIASDVWGQYGDFIGGLLGTFIAYIGIRLLVDTLNAQREANDTAADTNEENRRVFLLQQFDSNFNTLLKLYENTIASYKINDNKIGRDALHEYADQLLKVSSIEGGSYEERVKNSSNAFNQKFYIPHREVAAVHFRTLYQLFQLIRESSIDEGKKVLYAKIMRGQMSEDELLLLRYNCHCSYGKKMQTNINKFNLLKHLPMLSLLEFEKWRKKFKEKELINSLDTEFIALKKRIKDLLISSQIKEDKLALSDKYCIQISSDDSKKTLILEFIKNNDKKSINTIDKVFDACSNQEQKELFFDFLYETFVGSNFGVFNDFENLQIKHSRETDERVEMLKIKVANINDYVLTMNVRQYDDPV